MNKSLIFDLDGTLVDSSKGILLAMESAISSFSLPSIQLTPSLIGPPIRSVFSSLYPDLDNNELLDLVSAFRSFYDNQYFDLARPYARTLEVMTLLRKHHIDLYVVTNKGEKSTYALLSSLGWLNLFERVVCLDMLNDPLAVKSDALSLLLSQHYLNPSFTPYLGDRYEDYIASRHNNMPFILATWGYGSISDFCQNDIFIPLPRISSLTKICFEDFDFCK